MPTSPMTDARLCHPRLRINRAMACDQFRRFGGLAPDVIPEQEAVCMETREWITTTQRHDQLRGQERVVAGIAHSTGA